MAWTIDIRNTGEESTNPEPALVNEARPEATRLDIVKAGSVWRIRVSYTSGPDREYWRVGKGVLGKVGKTQRIEVFSADYPRYPYASIGFYGIEHVQSEQAKGEALFRKVPCLYYQGDSAAAIYEPVFTSDSKPKQEITFEAWFDKNTGLPVAYRAGGKDFIFGYPPNAPRSLTLPPEWQSALDKYQLDRRRAGLDK